MTQGQIDALQLVVNNEVILDALKQVFHDVVTEAMPTTVDMPNEIIGEKYRAYHESKYILGNAFTKLESYQKPDTRGNNTTRHI